jgi:hypothetical protein
MADIFEVWPANDWLILSLKFNHRELSAMLPTPAEMFVRGNGWELAFPILKPGDHVELVMRNNSKERRAVTSQLLGSQILTSTP